jgi:hypothetical protein
MWYSNLEQALAARAPVAPFNNNCSALLERSLQLNHPAFRWYAGGQTSEG